MLALVLFLFVPIETYSSCIGRSRSSIHFLSDVDLNSKEVIVFTGTVISVKALPNNEMEAVLRITDSYVGQYKSKTITLKIDRKSECNEPISINKDEQWLIYADFYKGNFVEFGDGPSYSTTDKTRISIAQSIINARKTKKKVELHLYYSDNKPALNATYENGQLMGKWEYYGSTGLSETSNYINGKMNGEWNQYNSNGSIYSTSIMSNGETVSYISYYYGNPHAIAMLTVNLPDKKVISKSFSEDGRLISSLIKSITDGCEEELHESFNRNGTIYSRILQYWNCEKEGYVQDYDKDGVLIKTKTIKGKPRK